MCDTCLHLQYFNFLCALLLYPAITYKVVIVTGKQLGGSTTTANVWMILAGEIKDTGIFDVPKGECEFRFQVRPIITLFILESSISSKLFFVEVQ